MSRAQGAAEAQCYGSERSVALYQYNPATGETAPYPAVPVGLKLRDCPQLRNDCTVLHTDDGEVLECGENTGGQLGVGDDAPHDGFAAARLPWPAAAVSGGYFTRVALRRGGTAVCTWGMLDEYPDFGFHTVPAVLGRPGDHRTPAEVTGLPEGDPIVLLAVGNGFSDGHVVVTTASDKAYGWGFGGIELGLEHRHRVERPVLIEALSGRGVRRLTCANEFSVAETADGQLLAFGSLHRVHGMSGPLPAVELAFPLRSLVADDFCVTVADAQGRVWRMEERRRAPSPGLRGMLSGAVRRLRGDAQLSVAEGGFRRVALPAPEHAARVALWAADMLRWDVVTLTASGRLLDCRHDGTCRAIRVAHPPTPQGMVPCSGNGFADRVALLPIFCGGKARLRLFARIAVCLGLPGDPVRAVLTGLVVHGDLIYGPAHDPFGWPDLADDTTGGNCESD